MNHYVNVLFAGDILFNQRFPYVNDGNIQKWQATLDDLIAEYPDATVIPGHGNVGDRDSLVALKNYFAELESLAKSWQQQGFSEEEAVASASEIPAAYQDYKFQAMYPENLKTAYQQITLPREN